MPGSASETEIFIPPQGGAADIRVHVGTVCILSFPDKLNREALASSADFEVTTWNESTVAVRTNNRNAVPATIAISAPGIKVNVTLRVVPATEPALTMVRFKPLSEALSFEARVSAEVVKRLEPEVAKRLEPEVAKRLEPEVAKRLEPARQRLEQAQRRFEQTQGQLEVARQRFDTLTRRRPRSVMIGLQLATGSAVVREAGTSEPAKVGSRSVAASASLAVRHWLDLGGELGATYLDEARYPSATLPIGAEMLSGPLRRSTNTAQLRSLATLRLGNVWMPVLQLSLGLGARFRSRAIMFVPTEQGSFWLPPDDQGAEVSLDLVTGLRAGFERRITLHWTAGLTAATAHVFGLSRPDLRMSDVAFSLSYSRSAR
jgi:hypothetical protein